MALKLWRATHNPKSYKGRFPGPTHGDPDSVSLVFPTQEGIEKVSQVLPVQMVLLTPSVKPRPCLSELRWAAESSNPSVVPKYHWSSRLAEKHLKKISARSLSPPIWIMIPMVWGEAKESEFVKAPLGDWGSDRFGNYCSGLTLSSY